MTTLRAALVLALCGSLACAAGRPQLAAAWCSGESDKICGQRYDGLYSKFDLYSADDGNRDGMLSWYGYRCALDPTSEEAADSNSQGGFDCWRASLVALAQGDAAKARKLDERGCEAWEWPDACALAATYAREKFELRAAHDFECRGKKAAEKGVAPAPSLAAVDCTPGADTVSHLRAVAKGPELAPPPQNEVTCALHGCTLASGRVIKPWIAGW